MSKLLDTIHSILRPLDVPAPSGHSPLSDLVTKDLDARVAWLNDRSPAYGDQLEVPAAPVTGRHCSQTWLDTVWADEYPAGHAPKHLA